MRAAVWAVVTGCTVISAVSAFNFSTSGTPAECNDLSVEWEGGQEPMEVVLIPAFGTPRNYSVPSSSISDGKGTFSLPLDIKSGIDFAVSVMDPTGILGTTGKMTIADSEGGSCNTTDPGVEFEFELNTALTQCQPYVFSGYSKAVKPVTIYAIIPGGDSEILYAGANDTRYQWTANVYNGTSLIFVMVDSQGRKGGASDFRDVATSNDISCITNNSPSTTAPASSTTSGDSEPTSATPSPEPESDNDSMPKAAIFASVFGSLIFLALAISLTLFYLRKRKERNGPGWVQGGGAGGGSGKFNFRRQSALRVRSEIDLPSGYHSSYPSGEDPFTPYSSPGHPQGNMQPSLSQRTSEYEVVAPPIDPFVTPPSGRHASMSSAQRKALAAGVGSHKPSRYVLHTDLEDIEPEADEEGVVELPPQYTARRAPPPPLSPPTHNPSTPTDTHSSSSWQHTSNTPNFDGHAF